MVYPDIMGCETGCEVVAAGFPVPYVADYPGFSPGNSVGLLEAFVFGMDRVLWGPLALSFAFWLAVAALVAGVWGRGVGVRASRPA